MCSCGETKGHEIARRDTADGFRVRLWSDGDLTDRFGFGLRGIGPARSDAARRADRMAADRLTDLIPLLERAELRAAVKAARRLARRPDVATLQPEAWRKAILGRL